jgi:signal peptidase I
MWVLKTEDGAIVATVMSTPGLPNIGDVIVFENQRYVVDKIVHDCGHLYKDNTLVYSGVVVYVRLSNTDSKQEVTA